MLVGCFRSALVTASSLWITLKGSRLRLSTAMTSVKVMMAITLFPAICPSVSKEARRPDTMVGEGSVGQGVAPSHFLVTKQ